MQLRQMIVDSWKSSSEWFHANSCSTEFIFTVHFLLCTDNKEGKKKKIPNWAVSVIIWSGVKWNGLRSIVIALNVFQYLRLLGKYDSYKEIKKISRRSCCSPAALMSPVLSERDPNKRLCCWPSEPSEVLRPYISSQDGRARLMCPVALQFTKMRVGLRSAHFGLEAKQQIWVK